MFNKKRILKLMLAISIALLTVSIVIGFFQMSVVKLTGSEKEKTIEKSALETSVSDENAGSAVNYKPESKKGELEINHEEKEVVRKNFDPASLEGLTEEEKRKRVLEAMNDCSEGKSDCTKITYNIQH